LQVKNSSSIAENDLFVVTIETCRVKIRRTIDQSSKMSLTFLFLPKIDMVHKFGYEKHILQYFFFYIHKK